MKTSTMQQARSRNTTEPLRAMNMRDLDLHEVEAVCGGLIVVSGTTITTDGGPGGSVHGTSNSDGTVSMWGDDGWAARASSDMSWIQIMQNGYYYQYVRGPDGHYHLTQAC